MSSLPPAKLGPATRRSARVPVMDMLGGVVPGFKSAEGSMGHWLSPSGPASWSIEPSGYGFWIVLLGAVFPGRPAGRDLLLSAGEWPWPLKAIRQVPGGPVSWAAETYVDGSLVTQVGLTALVECIGDWLSADPVAARAAPPPSRAVPPEGWEEALRETLGDGLEQVGGEFRMAGAGRPPLNLAAGPEGLLLRSTLVRSLAALPSASMESLLDLLAVANGRYRGCRFVPVCGQGGTREILLESGIPWSRFPTGLRERVAGTEEACRQLLQPCRMLAEEPLVGEAYREYVLPPPAAI